MGTVPSISSQGFGLLQGGKVLLHPQKARQGWEGVGFVPVTSPRTPKLGATLPTEAILAPSPPAACSCPQPPAGTARAFQQAVEHRSVPLKAAWVSFLRARGKLEQEEPKPGSRGCHCVHLKAQQELGIGWFTLSAARAYSGLSFFFTGVILICFSLTSNSLFLQNAERY